MKDGGLIHIYTGDGKGKTTCSLGLSLRCAGHGNKVLFVQFMKGRRTGELETLKLIPNIQVLRAKEMVKFSFQMNEEEKAQLLADHMALFEKVKNICKTESVDLLVLDEVLGAVDKNLFDKASLIEFLKNKPAELEVAMTGRNPAPELLEMADYVSEIMMCKHPYTRGIPAREGIER